MFAIFIFGDVTGQLEDCHPEFVTEITSKILPKLTKAEKNRIKDFSLQTERDWNLEVDVFINSKRIFNYSDFVPIQKYAKNNYQLDLKDYDAERIITDYIFASVRDEKDCFKKIVDSTLTIISNDRKRITKRMKLDSIDGVYIPADLNDAIKELDKLIDEESRTEILQMEEDEFTALAHMGIGLTIIRNGWSLWGKSRLSNFFNERGINHPDDMSGIILTSYYRHLNDQSINLDQQIMSYIQYWKKYEPIEKKNFPPQVRDVNHSRTSPYLTSSNQEEYVAFFKDINGDVQWIYDSMHGWFEAKNKTLKEYDKLNSHEDFLKWQKRYINK